MTRALVLLAGLLLILAAAGWLAFIAFRAGVASGQADMDCVPDQNYSASRPWVET